MTKLTGMDTVLRNLNREIGKIKGRTIQGLLKAGLLVQGDAQRQTPVDTGALKSSAYTVGIQEGDTPIVEVGYTQSYAPFVHEIDKNYTVGNWQFLRNSLDQNAEKVLRIIAEEAKIK